MDRDALTKFLLIFGGAGLGANARYWLGTFISERVGIDFPWGTFTINVTGSLVIGFVMGWLMTAPNSTPWRMLLVTGFLGGYTTFSSFSFETIRLLDSRSYSAAGLYVVGSCFLSFVGTWAGLAVVRAVVRS